MDAPQVSCASDLATRVRAIRLVAFDFDGVFTDNSVLVLEDGREAVRCWRGDGIGLRRLEQAGIRTLIISTEKNPVVSARAEKLKIGCRQGCDDKVAALGQVAAEMGISLREVAFVGNDINDLPSLSRVGVPIVVADAHERVVPCAIYRTRACGGQGAVREVCDLIVRLLEPGQE